jgi:hypothetical protein
MSASPAIIPTPAAPRAAPPEPGAGGSRRRRPVLRVVVTWLTAAVTLMLLSALLSTVDVDSLLAALGSAGLIGLINAFVWSVVIRLALPITVGAEIVHRQLRQWLVQLGHAEYAHGAG